MSHFEAAISDAAKQIETLNQVLDQAKSEWIGQIKKSLPDWFRGEARGAVAQNPDVAAELGAEKIAALKREVEELACQAPALVDQLIGGDLWPHVAKDQHGEALNPTAIWPANRNSVQPELGLRKLLWRVYPLLRKYELGPKGIIDAGWEKNEYPYALPDIGGTGPISARYIDLCNKRYLITQKLQQLRRDEKRAKAEKLWDEA